MAMKLKSVDSSGAGQLVPDPGERQRVVTAILREAGRAPEGPPPARSGSPDIADAAQETVGEIVTVATLERRRHKLAQVDEALCRLAAGRYGLCADCAEPIPPARLRALPFAVRCCPCQERFERRTGGSGAPLAGMVCRAPVPFGALREERPAGRVPVGTNGRHAGRPARVRRRPAPTGGRAAAGPKRQASGGRLAVLRELGARRGRG